MSIVDPEFLKDRTKDDDAVKAVEGRLKVGHDSKSIHTHPCSKLIEFHNCISWTPEESVGFLFETHVVQQIQSCSKVVQKVLKHWRRGKKYICHVSSHASLSIEPQFRGKAWALSFKKKFIQRCYSTNVFFLFLAPLFNNFNNGNKIIPKQMFWDSCCYT